MSLVMALTCPEGVVVVADNRMTTSPHGMNYPIAKLGKLQTVSSSIVGVVGSVPELQDILSAVKLDQGAFQVADRLAQDCTFFTEQLRTICNQKYGDDWHRIFFHYFSEDTALLLVTHADDDRGRIYRLSPKDYWVCMRSGPVLVTGIGQSLHGGNYFATRFGDRVRTLQQAAFLLYFCVREVGVVDASVGEPIDIMTIAHGNPQRAPSTWASGFSSRHAEYSNEMLKWFTP